MPRRRNLLLWQAPFAGFATAAARLVIEASFAFPIFYGYPKVKTRLFG